MKIRKPKYSLKQFRKKNFKHKKVLADFTEKQYTEYQTQRSKIFGYRKHETKLKNKKIRSINKRFVNPEIISKKIEQTETQYFKRVEQFYNPLQFTGLDKTHKYSKKLIWKIGIKNISDNISDLPNKKLREVVKYVNKKGLGGYVQIKIEYIDINGNKQWYSKTMYPQQKIELQNINDLIEFADDELLNLADNTAYKINSEKSIIYSIIYSLPL